MRARRYLTAAAVAGAMTLTGCAAAGGAEGDGDVAMTLWHNSTTGDGKQYWEDAAAAFEEENPGVSIEVQSIQNEDMDGRLQTAVNSGDMPDIFMARGGGKLADIVAAGAVKDLTDLIADDVRADYGDGVFDAFTVDGAVYGLPTAVLPGGIFYSEDLFAEAGIEPPTSMDELVAATDALKGADVAPIALGGMDAWPAAHWYYFFALRECGQDVMSDIATTRDFSDGCWLAAGEDLAEFAETEPFNEGFLTTPAQQGAGSSAGLLANHQAAMELMGGWNVGVIASLTPDQKPLADLGWFPFPAVEGGDGDPAAMMGGVDGYSCSVDSPSVCEDFLNFIASQEWQEKYAQAYQTIPASKAAQGAVTEPALEPLMAAYNDASYVAVWLDTSLGQNVGNALNTAVVEMLSGSGSPEGIVEAVEGAAARG
ncbi:extracellular solute-binding protein [Microbacterium oryzae]|uniref:ABC transporter substrate-binding protein n=1 Tax=Microbacterium oryzae TaxID=743009 RepID=UPI0025B0E4D7|nr:extracellular solute-binding protein [Microbacterium oryzae]MDN3309869.1 extracellular solute-binding protein [Microbacterium oryzae]